jgi:hypothetical protein
MVLLQVPGSRIKKKLLAALKLRNKIEQEVPDGHTTPVDTASADDDGDI